MQYYCVALIIACRKHFAKKQKKTHKYTVFYAKIINKCISQFIVYRRAVVTFQMPCNYFVLIMSTHYMSHFYFNQNGTLQVVRFAKSLKFVRG